MGVIDDHRLPLKVDGFKHQIFHKSAKCNPYFGVNEKV